MTRLEKYDESLLIKNPLAKELRIPISYARGKGYTIEKGQSLPNTFPVERTIHVRLFYTPGTGVAIAKLSDAAQRLFLYIVTHLEPNKDFVQINHENFMSQNGVKSINTFKKAKKELIRELFIVPSEYKTVFWINPDIFFPGNRIRKYEDNCFDPYPNKYSPCARQTTSESETSSGSETDITK